MQETTVLFALAHKGEASLCTFVPFCDRVHG
jgi:hypothetical protein